MGKFFLASICLILGTSTLAYGDKSMAGKTEVATLGGGCFWCIEAIFEKVNGVLKVESGYTGGNRTNPTYEQVSSGATGHAEVVQVSFDPSVITFAEILEIFFHLHDPTTLNQQGADIGTQYRSAIFYADEKQHATAEEVKHKIGASGLWKDPIVTEITPLKEYYRAEDYHQNYYENNKTQRYCSLVIAPKIQKLYKDFKPKLKSGT